MGAMQSATLVPVEEYLKTVYRPDCEYVDGVLLERNVGEHDQARLQILIAGFFLSLEKTLRIYALTEARVQVRPTRFRVPDICVLRGGHPAGSIVTEAPFLCVEILSPEDRMSQVHSRIDDYLEMGVRFVWLIDPATRECWVFTKAGVERHREGILKTSDPDIVLNLAELPI